MLSALHARLAILMFLQFFLWGSWFVTTGTYLLETLQFSGRQVGMVYGTAAIAATVSPFFLGVLADRLFASEKLLAILHAIGGLLMLLLGYMHTFPGFYLVVLAYMLCYLPTFSLANALCFHHLEDVKKEFPPIRVWGSVSWILAGLLVSYLGVEDQVVPIQIAAGTSFIQAAYCLSLPHTPPSSVKGPSLFRSLFSPEIKALLQDRSFMVMIGAIALICIPSAYYYSFVNPFLNDIGMENAAGKMSIGQVTEIVFMLTLPWFFRIMRLKTILFMGLAGWGIRYGLLMVGIETGNEWWYYLSLSLHGIAFIFAMLSAQIYLDTRVPDHLRSTAQGFYSLLTLGIGALIGAYIAGETVSSFTLANGQQDWYAIWQVPFIWGTVVALGFFLLFKSKAKG